MAVKYLDENSREFCQSDEFLFRVITLDRFIELQEDKIVFISPSKWSDPYEKAFMEANYHFEDEVYRHPLGKNEDGHHVYAQCWSGNKQNEAMWKVFAPNGDGVLLKIRVQGLIEILEDLSSRGSFDFYVGNVDYINEETMYSMKGEFDLWNDIRDRIINNRTLNLLFKKREAFRFENEFRIFAVKRAGVNQGPILKLKFEDVLNKLEYVKFDPRMGEKLFSFTKRVLRLSYPNLNIHKSRLYRKPIKNLYYGQNIPEVRDDEIFID